MAQNHYLQVTDAHFAKAVAELKDQSPGGGAAQNQAQSEPVSVGKCEESGETRNENRPDLPSDSDQSRCLPNNQVAATGLEPVTRGL